MRTPDEIMGKAELKYESERWKIDLGNVTMRGTTSIALCCCAQVVPWTVENPRLSMLWLAPPMLHLARRRIVNETVLDFCMYGTSWKKPTKLLGAFVSFELVSKRCHASGKCCERSGASHIALTGANENGIFMTKVAEAYPRRFAMALARTLVNGVKNLQASSWASVLR